MTGLDKLHYEQQALRDEWVNTYWTHKKTNSLYSIVDFVVREVDLEPMVIYRKPLGMISWCRPVHEFFDGRFVRHGN